MTEYVLDCEFESRGSSNGNDPNWHKFGVRIDENGNMDIETCYRWDREWKPSDPIHIHDNVQIPPYLLEVIKCLMTPVGGGEIYSSTYHSTIIPAIQKIKEGLAATVSQATPDATTWQLLVAKNAKLESDIIALNQKHDELSAKHKQMQQDLLQEIYGLKSRYAEKEDNLRKRETELREREKKYEESSRAVRTADENRALKDWNAKLAAEWAEMDRKFKDTLVYNADLREEVRMLRDRSNHVRPENQYSI